jgi:hypothetical protein
MMAWQAGVMSGFTEIITTPYGTTPTWLHFAMHMMFRLLPL